MARKEELRVELTATDKLSKVVDKAAKAVEDLDGETAEVEVTADADKAEQSIEDVEKALTDLDGETAEATISILEAEAEAELDDMMKRLQDLDDEEVTAVLKGKATQLEALIKEANAQLASVDGRDATAIINVKDQASAKLKAVNARVDDLQGGLGRVNTSGTQSRSVLANLAGNSAQDFGELGGVVGSLGVGVGQLAEYAVDGNIKMKELAKVALPMAGLAATLALVQAAVGTIAKKSAWRKEQVESYAKAVDAVGVGVGAIEEHLRNLDTITFFDEGGITDWFMGGDSEISNVAAVLGTFGMTVDEVSGYIANGAQGQEDFEQALIDSGLAASVHGDYLKWLEEQQAAYGTATAESEGETRFFAESLDSANAALTEFNTQNNATEDPAFLRLFRDMNFDGTIDNLGLLQSLMDKYGISAEEAFERAVEAGEAAAGGFEKAGGAVDGLTRAFSEAKTPAGGLADALEDAKTASEEHAQAIRDEEIAALEDEQAALEATIETLEGYIDAQRDAYDTQIDYREATENAEDALADYNKALTETDDETGELLATQEEINDAGEDFVQSVLDQSDALIEQNRAQAAANGTIYSGTQAIEDQNAALLATASTIPDELLPAFAEMIAAINGIPEEKETILRMLREGVDPEVILGYLNGISGTHAAAIEVEANQAAINQVASDLANLTRDRHVNIYYHGHQASNDQGHRASGGPVNAGGSYTVGERGTELFVPDQNGTIIPAGQTAHLMSAGSWGGGSAGVGGGAVYHVAVNMPPGSNGQDVLNALQRLQRTNGPLPLRIAG